MSDYDRNVAARGFGAARAEAIDVGLRAYMIRVYNYMAAGVALTGVVAWLTFNAAVVTDAAGRITALTPFGQAIFSGPLAIVRNGDPIALDVDARTIELELDAAEVERRRADLPDPVPRYARGYGRLYIDHVMQADAGCDFDFLEGTAPIAEPEIH